MRHPLAYMMALKHESPTLASEEATISQGALRNLKVLDFEQYVAGPVLGLLLAAAGCHTRAGNPR